MSNFANADETLPDPPELFMSAAASREEGQASLTMLFAMHAETLRRGQTCRKKQSKRAKALIDTGSSHCFVSEKFRPFVTLNGATGQVKLADSGTKSLCQFGTMQLQFGGCSFQQTVGLMPLNSSF